VVVLPATARTSRCLNPSARSGPRGKDRRESVAFGLGQVALGDGGGPRRVLLVVGARAPPRHRRSHRQAPTIEPAASAPPHRTRRSTRHELGLAPDPKPHGPGARMAELPQAASGRSRDGSRRDRTRHRPERLVTSIALITYGGRGEPAARTGGAASVRLRRDAARREVAADGPRWRAGSHRSADGRSGVWRRRADWGLQESARPGWPRRRSGAPNAPAGRRRGRSPTPPRSTSRSAHSHT